MKRRKRGDAAKGMVRVETEDWLRVYWGPGPQDYCRFWHPKPRHMAKRMRQAIRLAVSRDRARRERRGE